MDPRKAAACILPRGDFRTAVTLEATRGGVDGLDASAGPPLPLPGDEGLDESASPLVPARDA